MCKKLSERGGFGGGILFVRMIRGESWGGLGPNRHKR